MEGIEMGVWSFMLQVTITPTSAQVAGTTPNPNLVIEKQEFVGLQNFSSVAVSALRFITNQSHCALTQFALKP